MRKVSMLLVLALCLVMISATSSWAGTLLFDGTFKWREGGTVIVDQTNAPTIKTWIIGNPVGADLVEVFQKDFILGARDKEVNLFPELLGKTKFTWEIVNDDYDPIYSFHVKAWGYAPLIAETNVADWTISYEDGYYNFTTTDDPIWSTDRHEFAVVNSSPGYSFNPAAIDGANGSEWLNGNGFWVASGPVPEPSSMMLLGMGLVGFAGSIFRKRFVA